MTLTWRFPRTPLTANQRMRMHWAERGREAAVWRSLVLCICGLPRFGEVIGRIRLRVEMCRQGTRLQDPDNRASSVKPLLDALVKAGWLYDDDGKHLELSVTEVKGKVPETVVTWERSDETTSRA
jgi:hypothetical protein